MFKYIVVVGYPKTGTTYLQNLLFNTKNINFYDKRNFLHKKNLKDKIKNKFIQFLNLKPKNIFKFEKDTFFLSRLFDYHVTNSDLSEDKDQLNYLRKLIFNSSSIDKDNFIEIGVIRPGLIKKSLKNLKLLFENQEVTILVTFRNNIDFLRSRINHDAAIFPKSLEIKHIKNIISEKACTYPWCIFNGKCFSNCQLVKVKTYCELYLDYYLTYKEIQKYFDKIKVNIFENGIYKEMEQNFPNIKFTSYQTPKKKINFSNYKISREFILSILDEDFKKNIKNSNYKLQTLLNRKFPEQYFEI